MLQLEKGKIEKEDKIKEKIQMISIQYTMTLNKRRKNQSEILDQVRL